MKEAVKAVTNVTSADDEMIVEGIKEDQLEHFKKLVKKQKQKIKSLECDLKDINYENYKDKEELLEEIRSMNKETKMQNCILGMLLTKEELEIIKSVCEYKEESQEYRVPPFYFKNKKLVFPKVNETQGLDLAKDFKENRDLVFEKKEEAGNPRENRDTSIQKSNNEKENSEYSLNSVIKNAKGSNTEKIPHKTPPTKKDRAALANANLEPIAGQRPIPSNEENNNLEPKLLRKGQLSPLRKPTV
jgi:hypothetical protein